MKRRSGLQMTFLFGQENEKLILCKYTLPYHYFIRDKIYSKRSVKYAKIPMFKRDYYMTTFISYLISTRESRISPRLMRKSRADTGFED